MVVGIFIIVLVIAQCETLTLAHSVTLCVRREKYIDCSNLDLKSVPDEIPADTESIILHNNSISGLPPGIFSKFVHLLCLDLSNNKLKHLHQDLFKGVHTLQTLDLSYNNDLPFNYDGFPIGLFLPLGRSLQTLRLLVNLKKHVAPIRAYPDKSIADLYNLRTLQIGMFTGVAFGSGFANLTKLHVLQTKDCYIEELHNNTLRYLRNSELEYLHMDHCSILMIEPGTFSGLPKLKFLDLSSNTQLGLEAALESLHPLEQQRLTEIRLIRFHLVYAPITFSNAMWMKLRNICVETLDISDNLIVTAEFSALAMLKYPDCFKTIRAAKHLLIRMPVGLLIYLSLLRNLTELDFSGKPGRRQHNRQRRMTKQGLHYTHDLNTRNSIESFYVVSPRYLKVLNMSYAIGHASADAMIRLGNAENIEIFDASYSDIHHCYFSFEGLTNLKSFNISYSDCSDMKKEFLFAYENLTTLSFRKAALAEGLKNDPDGIFLSKQRNLEYLDLCCNGFTTIHDKLLIQNKKIGSINLSHNKFVKIPESVLNSATLRHVDMSFNLLSSLTEYERHILDSRVRPDAAFSLILNGNPFVCSCSTIDFLEWLAETHVILDNAGNYSCVSENGTLTSTTYQISHLREIRVRCVSDFWLRFSAVCCGLALLAVISSAFGYRYRWNIKYWFLTRCTRRQNLPPGEGNYTYDVFVAYNHEDYQWVCGTLRTFLEETGPHKYRLCLHHRDFPVGESIQGNIVSAMNDSRKIILVLTTRFLTCTWGEYEMEIAAMRKVSGTHSGDGVIIAVLLDDVPTRLMPTVLLNMWKNITFLVWIPDPLDEQMFWSRLSEAMER